MKLLYLLLLLLIIPIASAATIEGNIYDLSFNKITQGTITINTTPIQNKVLTNGYYKFEVPKGNYLITANQYQDQILTQTINQTIKIQNEGIFTLDLILYPIETNNYEELDNIDQQLEELIDQQNFSFKSTITRFTYIALAFLLLFIFYKYMKKKNFFIKEIKETNDIDLDSDILEKDILNFIISESTTTQKIIRNKFPQYSEAKISLIIKKLEYENKIKKYKKGRSNIISKSI